MLSRTFPNRIARLALKPNRLSQLRCHSTFGDGSDGMEYAFEMASSSVRFGKGVTREVGFDVINLMGPKAKVCVVTDRNLVNLPPVRAVLDSLTANRISYEVFDNTSVEPTDKSLKVAIDFCRARQFDGFIAVGGGSVIDTAKAANLYMCRPNNELMDFVNAPIGRGLPIGSSLMPLIAIPTTAGTGSETTGIVIFDDSKTGAKTGIRDRALRPLLGIIDPEHTKYCSPELTAFSGLDVLCHALESFTAVPFRNRGPAPAQPNLRPAYQGCNPISDIWSSFALRTCAQNIRRAVEDGDLQARENMALASTSAGVGFGNAGVHLCHGMSYPISSRVRDFKPTGYTGGAIVKPYIVPHGLSVVLSAPAVFQWTASADGDKHLKAAELLGANTANVKPADAGLLLADTLRTLLSNWKFIPDGLKGVGYSTSDIDVLVKGTLPQKKVLDISPRQANADDLAYLFEKSMRLFS